MVSVDVIKMVRVDKFDNTSHVKVYKNGRAARIGTRWCSQNRNYTTDRMGACRSSCPKVYDLSYSEIVGEGFRNGPFGQIIKCRSKCPKQSE